VKKVRAITVRQKGRSLNVTLQRRTHALLSVEDRKEEEEEEEVEGSCLKSAAG
jgi:hypothetical protein